ncbi:MAG: SurA N-terminal domain-containing protein [Natronospirillum sp.]
MLDGIRNGAKGPTGKIIVGVLVLSFGLFGVSSVVPLVFGGKAPVTVNGDDISANEIAQRVQQERQQLLQQLGGEIDPSMITEAMVRPQVVERLIQQRLIAQAASNADFAMSSDSVDRILARETAFQTEGRFDPQTFSRIAAQQGMSPTQLRDAIAASEVTNQWVTGLQQTEFVLPYQVEQYGEYSNQQRDIEYAILQPDDYLADVTVSDDEIAQYYDLNQGDFTTAEQVSAEYVIYPRARLEAGVEPTEDELQQAYDAYVAAEGGDAERTIAHILITADDRSAEEARELAETVQARAQEEAFEELANTYSDDPGSAAFGGDLGVFQTGVFGDDFEQAVLALNQVGDITPIIETEFGYHVIKLTSLENDPMPSFEGMQDDLRAQLLERGVGMQLSVVRDEIANIAFSSLDLSELAETFDLTVETTGLFSREGGSGMLANAEVVAAAFSDAVLNEDQNSDVVVLDDSSLLVLRKAAYEAPGSLPLAEVEDEIRGTLQNEKASTLAEAEAERIFAALDASETPNMSLERRSGVTRFTDDLSDSIMNAIFRAAVPEEGEQTPFLANTNAGWAVGQVVGVHAGEVDDAERAQVEQFLRQTARNSAVESAYGDLREQATIRIR